ncbi:hypothetical protein L1887_02238 [Cichorium endivia]|nr:hypothetical protein L1887_02238 [Cichorium endivia]
MELSRRDLSSGLGWSFSGETSPTVGVIRNSRELFRGRASGCYMARYQVSLALGIITYAQLFLYGFFSSYRSLRSPLSLFFHSLSKMSSSSDVGPDSRYYDSLVARYGFQPKDGVELPVDGAVFSLPPEGKIGMYLKHFEAGYRLPISDFFREVLDYYHVHIHQLVPNGVNKVVVFELLSRPVHLEPDLYVFRHFFRFTRASTGNNHTFCVRQDRPTFVTDQRGTARNWTQHFIWVDQHRVGALKHRVDPISDRAFTLFHAKEAIAKVLRSFRVVGGEFPEYILAGAGMSTSWRLQGKMPEFFSIHDIRFTDVLAKTYPGSLQYHEIPLIDRVLPSRAFRHEAFITRASAVQEEERGRDAGAGPLVFSIVDARVVSQERVGDAGASGEHGSSSRALVKRRAALFVAGDSSANVVLPRRLRPRRLAGGSGASGFVPAQSPVINIADDTSQGEDMETDQRGGARIGTYHVVENVTEEGSGESSGEASHVASAGVFVPGWSLTEGARLSTYQTAMEFTQHAFPPSTRSEMGIYSPADLVGSLRYAVAQSACFFSESANRLPRPTWLTSRDTVVCLFTCDVGLESLSLLQDVSPEWTLLRLGPGVTEPAREYFTVKESLSLLHDVSPGWTLLRLGPGVTEPAREYFTLKESLSLLQDVSPGWTLLRLGPGVTEPAREYFTLKVCKTRTRSH